MGAKTPTKLKLRRPTYKCGECEKKFLSAQALKTHYYCSHKMKMKPKTKGKLMNLLGKSVKRPPGRPRKDVKDPPVAPDISKIEYECPQCRQKFAVCFSAIKHIQKYHCVNSKGEKVPPNSPDLIKPVCVETCIKCQMRVRSNEEHECLDVSSTVISGVDTPCICLGCQQSFPTVFMFDLHVSGLHSDCVETFFFPNVNVFSLWKSQMESNSGAKFLILGKCASRQTYRCSHAEQNTTSVHFCPSTIVVKEYTKTIQVNFYKEHHGHTCKYKMPDRFKKYLSTDVMKKCLPSTETHEGEDLYVKFKSVMEAVTLTAADADTDTMKQLYEKAVEMAKILKPDSEPPAANKNMTDAQITELLETLGEKKISEATRKMAGVDQNVKKGKPLNDALLSSNRNSESPVACFNDSYKEFVGKITAKKTEEEISAQKKDSTSPNKSRLKNVKTYSNKKKVVKTRIGQFKPSLSPKKESVKVEDIEENSTHSFNSSKLSSEMDYEVVEQENDYNILILKI